MRYLIPLVLLTYGLLFTACPTDAQNSTTNAPDKAAGTSDNTPSPQSNESGDTVDPKPDENADGKKDEGEKVIGLAIYKLGEPYATDEKAGEAIDTFADYLAANVKDLEFERRGVRNKPADALKLLRDETRKVSLAIVSPSFYLKHKDTLKLEVLAEARRGDHDGEQYVLAGDTSADSYPSGKRIATTMDADTDWLNKVVLRQPKDTEPVEWVHYDNLLDAGYEIIDEEEGAPDFVLVDRVTLDLFKKDMDLKSFKFSMESEVLPQDLVVEVDGRLGDKRDEIKRVLNKLSESEEGKKIGELLQSPNFPDHNEARLEKVKQWYDAE